MKPRVHLLLLALTLLVGGVCLSVGSVPIPLTELPGLLFGKPDGANAAILTAVRLPRVLTALLMGASLALSGAAMQGLLRNPLADGSTLGVASGAALGAVLALSLSAGGFAVAAATQAAAAALCAFLSLLLILTIAYRLDHALSTQTILLLGVIFSMLFGALTSLIVAFSGERVRTITFWLMGSLSSGSATNVWVLAASLIAFGGPLLCLREALNAFALGEDNARSVGVEVRRVKLAVLVCASALIGVSVAFGGVIGFVGLIVPHMIRRVAGPNHRVLLPAAAYGGAMFLALADLLSRTVIQPVELPIGVVTSILGALTFLAIFCRTRGTNVC